VGTSERRVLRRAAAGRDVPADPASGRAAGGGDAVIRIDMRGHHMRQPMPTLLLAAALASAAPALAAPTKAVAEAAKKAAAAPEYVEKGIGFSLPRGFPVAEHQESEPGGDADTVYVARKDGVEVRVEVEDGYLDCKEILDAKPRLFKAADGRETCEAEAKGPPDLGAANAERRAAMVSVQFPGRHLSVIVFAVDKGTAIRVARQVAATGVEAK